MNRIFTVALILIFVSGCAPMTWRYQFEQQGKTPNLRQLDQLQCQYQFKPSEQLEPWWEIDDDIGGCMRQKGYRYAEAEAIVP